jgi:hypothetical protein
MERDKRKRCIVIVGVLLDTLSAATNRGFTCLQVRQWHFILYSSDKQ